MSYEDEVYKMKKMDYSKKEKVFTLYTDKENLKEDLNYLKGNIIVKIKRYNNGNITILYKKRGE